MTKKLTYKTAGVDITEGNLLIDKIKPYTKMTKRTGTMSSIGGFGALFSGSFKGIKNPVLVSATDGVGTKLKVAFMTKKFDTVGIDLVAMCVNDLIVCGAEPLFFLDYYATGKLKSKDAALVIKGIAKGCKESNSALIGGETAEMPGMYQEGEFDLAGFSVGVVDKKNIVDGKKVKNSDVIIGIGSSGLHSNGYSLARKVFFDKLKLKHSSKIKGLNKSIGEELLKPTKIYVKSILTILKKYEVNAMAHITGGGLIENLPRVMPKNLKATIDSTSWKRPKIFDILQKEGDITDFEMMRTFNNGIGYVLVVKEKDSLKILNAIKKLGEKAYIIGSIEKRKAKEESVIIK